MGNPGDIIDWVYEPQTPSVANSFATIKVIENDRLGNVTEFFYDAKNQEVIRREYTGRAPDPDGPTSSTLNRPGSPLRGTDPAYFETRWQYNADGLVTRVDYPEGNFTRNVYEVDLDPNADPISRGNLREVHQEAGPRGSQSQTILSTFYTYRVGSGGCCGTNFVLTETDGRGAVTTHQYDAAGNRTQTIDRLPGLVHNWTYNAFGQVTSHTWPALAGTRRVDAFAYHAAGVQAGFLERTVVDQSALALTTTYEYDCVGNVTRKIDPRGNDTLYVVNQLDQVVAEYSPEVSAGGVRYETLVSYDANDNIVRVDDENRDDSGALGANTHFTTSYQHEILNEVTRITYEVAPAVDVVTEFVYDANRNQLRVRKGEATSGGQPANVVDTVYDERDLPFRVGRASGAAAQSTTQFDYDRNGNTRFVRSGIEGTARVTETAYDGHDRLQDTIDPMGNLRTYRYDANSNLTQVSVLGQLVDDQNAGPRVLLTEQSAAYDAADRVTSETKRHFDPATGSPIGDGNATTTYTYDGPSLLTREQDDRGNVTTVTYDTAHRPRVEDDAKHNLRVVTYDANSNVTAVREDDVSDSGAATQVFTTTYVFDGLDRATRVTDNRGNAVLSGFDSRHNLVRTVDALGNETRREYDGLNRLLRTIRDMNGNGASAADPADIVTRQSFDATSRLIRQGDDNGNETQYFYDALDRLIEERFADGTRTLTTYDVHDNPITTTDANGSVVTDTFDLLDRLTRSSIVAGPGVSAATTFEAFQYDGNSRGIRFEDDDSLVLRKYDSLDNVVEETLDGRRTQSSFDGTRNELTRTYPGGTVVQRTYDGLNQMRTSGLGSALATYDYVGRGRIERRTNGNGTRSRLEYDGYTGATNPPGDFGVGRVVRTLHDTIAGATVLDDRSYGWDRRGSKTVRRDTRTGGPQRAQQFTYDRSSRMTQSTRTGSPVNAYTLDGVNNRTNAGYILNGQTPTPADLQVNQYTKAARPLASKSDRDVARGRVAPPRADSRTYDENGNLIGMAMSGVDAKLVYDYANQMVEYDLLGKRTTYRYDALGRRIGKSVSGSGAVDYVWAGNELIEERAGGNVVAVFIYGAEADVPAFLLRAGQAYTFHSDDQGSVTAITDSLGNVVERYDYGDFGAAQIFAPGGALRAASAIGNSVLYNGRWLDAESGFYRFDTRYLEPGVGRFTTRDTIGIWGDPMGLGNGYTFVGNNPWSYVDPTGTAAGEGIKDVEVGLKKRPGGELAMASINTSRSNIKDKEGLAIAAASTPRPKTADQPTGASGRPKDIQAAASINTSRSNIKDKETLAIAVANRPRPNVRDLPVGSTGRPKDIAAAASINTSRSNIKDKESLAIAVAKDRRTGPTGRPKDIQAAASINTSRSNIKDKEDDIPAKPKKAALAGEGIKDVEVGLKKRPGGELALRVANPWAGIRSASRAFLTSLDVGRALIVPGGARGGTAPPARACQGTRR